MSEVKITIREQGSIRIEGDIPVYDQDGNRMTVPIGRPYGLCRCGGSSRKPFCDGSHKTNGFEGTFAEE